MSKIYLTAKDHLLIEAYLERHKDRDPVVVAMAQAKLASARVVFTQDVPADVATLNSRVRYRLDGGPVRTCQPVHWGQPLVPGLTIPINTPLGMALLGLRPGQTLLLPRRDGSFETLMITEIAYQPEAARNQAQASVGDW